MSKVRPPYPAECRQKMVTPVRAGRAPSELPRGFHITAKSIANWVILVAFGRGKALPCKEGLTSAEREELVRLCRHLRQVQQERDILAIATAWFAVVAMRLQRGLRSRDVEPCRLPLARHVPR